MTFNIVLAAASVLALGACSRQAAGLPPASETAPAAAPAPAPGSATGPTVGGDGSQIALSPLTPAEMTEARLVGELACSFTERAGMRLVLAKGNAGGEDPAFGVVKVGASVERIAAPGGFDRMVGGATFSGAGKTLRVVLTGPPTGGGESPSRPATLTYMRADGAERTFVGRWECGP